MAFSTYVSSRIQSLSSKNVGGRPVLVVFRPSLSVLACWLPSHANLCFVGWLIFTTRIQKLAWYNQRPWSASFFFGAIFLASGQLWFSWTCTLSIHWLVPILASVPFGVENACIFIYASNYISRSYGIYAASALAGNMLTRSIMGAILPLAGPSLYKALGLNWASTILGIVETVCISIPVVFYFNGHRIRKASPSIKDRKKMQVVWETSLGKCHKLFIFV